MSSCLDQLSKHLKDCGVITVPYMLTKHNSSFSSVSKIRNSGQYLTYLQLTQSPKDGVQVFFSYNPKTPRSPPFYIPECKDHLGDFLTCPSILSEQKAMCTNHGVFGLLGFLGIIV